MQVAAFLVRMGFFFFLLTVLNQVGQTFYLPRPADYPIDAAH